MAAGPTPTQNDPKLLASGQLAAADAVMYTAPAGEQGCRLTAILLTNTLAANVTATLYHSPGGGAGVAADEIMSGATIPADGYPTVVPASDRIIMDESDEIRGFDGAGAQVSYKVYGIEMEA